MTQLASSLIHGNLYGFYIQFSITELVIVHGSASFVEHDNISYRYSLQVMKSGPV